MQWTVAARQVSALVGAGLITVLLMSRATPAAELQNNPFQDGKAGFVITRINYALGRGDNQAQACPFGVSSGYRTLGELFVTNPNTPADAAPALLEAAQQRVYGALDLPTLCENPERGHGDSRWHSVTGAGVESEGIDLDGQNSRANDRAAPGTCAHDDFRGSSGERGIDNQFHRAFGCGHSFNGQFDADMRSGAWGILMTLSGVEDVRNDPDVEVRFYANADPMQLSPNREPLVDATYAFERDERYQATAHGRIVNGVLTTDPVDVRFHWIVNTIRLDRPLQDARVRMTFTPSGGLEGYLAGYTPVEAMYDMHIGFRNGRDSDGEPASLPLRALSAVGSAVVHNITCEGAYFALLQNADGHRDPRDGRCTSISTQYRIDAVPAFVVDAQTRSVNADLDH